MRAESQGEATGVKRFVFVARRSVKLLEFDRVRLVFQLPLGGPPRVWWVESRLCEELASGEIEICADSYVLHVDRLLNIEAARMLNFSSLTNNLMQLSTSLSSPTAAVELSIRVPLLVPW